MDFRKALPKTILTLIALMLASITQAAVSVNLKIENLSGTNMSNVPITVGQVFKEGDISSSETVGALLNGTNIPVQVDKKANHRDGSLRHAVLTFHLPSLQAGKTEVITLYNKSTATSGSNVTLSQLLATNFDSVITLNVSGKTYTASAKQLLQSTTPKVWLSGTEVGEWIVSGAFKDSGNNPHPHLTARFNIRAYAGMNSVRISAIVENNWTFIPNPSNFTYDVTVAVAGNQVYSKNNVTHYHHARWRKVFWWGNNPQVHVIHDFSYLKQAKVISNYDYRLKISDSTMSSYYSTYRNANNDIMGISILNPYMPSTGGRQDIGPLPQWTVMYLVSMDNRAWDITKTIAELGGSWSMHFRDEKTDLPVTITDYPTLTTHTNLINDPYNPMRTCTSCGTPYTSDESHQPSFAYVPYMVTGDYYFLEELQFWANQNSFFAGSTYRGDDKGYLNFLQTRGQAWSMRTLAETAYITPDSHPLKSYFETLLMNNIVNYNSRYTGSGSKVNNLGIVVDGGSAFPYNNGRAMAPWQDDFFTWSMGHIVELGYTEAIPMYKFKSKFPVERMTSPDFCWIFGSIYNTTVKDANSSTLYTNFKDVFQNSTNSKYWTAQCGGQQMASDLGLKVGEMVGYSDSSMGYPSNMQPALAVAADSGIPNAVQAWEAFEARSVKPDYNTSPIWAIVPRTYRKPSPPTNIQIQVN